MSVAGYSVVPGGGGSSSGYSVAPSYGAPSGGHSSFLGTIAHDIASPVEHIAKDVGETAIGIPLGLYGLGKTAIEHPEQLPQLAKGAVKYYEDFYGHNVLHHIWQHPTSFALDLLTVADLGTSALAKVGDVANIERLSNMAKPAELATRSAKAAESGTGDVITRMTGGKPIVKARQLAAHRLSGAIDRVINAKVRDNAVGVGPLEARRYGRYIQQAETHTALQRIQPLFPHVKAYNKLSQDERTALNARSLDVKPEHLQQYWTAMGATKNLGEITDKVAELMRKPSKRMLQAEPLMKHLSGEGADLYKLRGMLSNEAELDRPGRFRNMVAEHLGLDPTEVSLHGDPWYLPHTTEPVKGSGALQSVGGGPGEPRDLGTMKKNTGELFNRGLLDLHNDVLGPEFNRRVKWLKFWGIHQALKRGAIRMTYNEIMDRYDGKAPKGYDFLRTSVPQRESQVLARRITALEKRQGKEFSPQRQAALERMYDRHADLRLGEKPDNFVGMRKQRIPSSVRGEGEVHLHDLIRDPEDLHNSVLSEGFTTNKMHEAYTDESQNFYLVPKAMKKAAAGEFTRAGSFLYWFNKNPMRVWRSLLLGLRPAFFVNNVVGNSIMYAMKTGGRGAVRDLFGVMREMHGDKVARRLLDDPSTPADMRAELEAQLKSEGKLSPIREHFPEQGLGATFGFTQTPSTQGLRSYPGKTARAFKTGTAALPHVTARVAEQYPREALVRGFIRRSPEYKALARSMPRETRTFNQLSRQLLEGKGGRDLQRRASEFADRSLGNYIHLNSFERNVMRNALPFYAWYRAILSTSLHLATDNPLRAKALYSLGQIGAENALNATLPSYLQGAVPLPGQGPGGTERLLSTQSINPYATLGQLSQGMLQNIGSLGLNPFVQGVLDAYTKIQSAPGATNKNVSAGALLDTMLNSIVMNLPPMAQVLPAGPSRLYPNRGRGDLFAGVPVLGSREAALAAWLGVPIKEPDPGVALMYHGEGQ